MVLPDATDLWDPCPVRARLPDYEQRLAASVSEVVKAVDQGHIPAEQYDAVLIDEAHDFEPQWLALAAKMVNPRTKALMVVYDLPASSRETRASKPLIAFKIASSF